MNNLAHVKDNPDLKRDLRTGTLVTTHEELENYRKQKAMRLKEIDRDREFKTLKNDVKDLKELIRDLIGKLDK